MKTSNLTRIRQWPIMVVVLLIWNTGVSQTLKPADIFGDNMVLQQNSSAPLWGTAKKSASIVITTSWNNQEYKITADDMGFWKVKVNTPKASFTSHSIKIETLSEHIEIHKVLIGEVWLTSGQSNMSMPLKGYYCQPVEGSNKAIMDSKLKKINFININPMAAYIPIDTFSAKWTEASLETVGECSAVAWFFADLLYRELEVPIGIINASYGGSNVEAWMNNDACKRFKDIEIPVEKKETSPWINNVPTVLYNGMIHPIVGYRIQGVLWYQGESSIFNVPRYAPSVVAMVEEWRKLWDCGDFAFYLAQITPYEYLYWNFFKPQWPEISAYMREAQRKIPTMLSNCAISVNMDLGHPSQIHPSKKKEVGERLALLALKKTYAYKGMEFESPEYERMEIDGEKVILHFKNQFNGLSSFEQELKLFEIAGDNQVFIPAKATIDGDKGTVVVWSKLVSEPKAVRYAFKNWVVGELFGTGGLPISSFKTDDWDVDN